MERRLNAREGVESGAADGNIGRAEGVRSDDTHEGEPSVVEHTTDDLTLDTGGLHSRPESAPHYLAQETGTPRFSKGAHAPERRLTAATLTEEEHELRAAAQAPSRLTLPLD